MTQSTRHDFQRARSPEQRETRRRAILDAAADLVTQMPVADISLRELSRRVGLAKSNVLRYFESREAVFLELLDGGWTDWLIELAELLAALPGGALRPEAPAGTAGSAEVAAVARVVAESLAERALLCELTSVTASVLERNVSVAVARRFKIAAMNHASTLAALVREKVPGLDQPGAQQFAAATFVVVAGLWPLANPCATMVAAYSDPQLAAARTDFVTALRALLTAQLAGVLS